MPSNLIPTGLGGASGPFNIELTDCMGDSVSVINANTNYLASFTAAVSATAATKEYVDTFNRARTYSAINRTYTGLRTIAPPGTGILAQRLANPLWTTYLSAGNIVSTAKTFQINGRINYDVYFGGSSKGAAVVDWFGRLIINDSIVVDVNGTNGHAGSFSSTYHLLLQAAYTLPNNITISSIKLQLANPNDANPVINNTHSGTDAYASNNNIYYSSRLDVIAF